MAQAAGTDNIEQRREVIATRIRTARRLRDLTQEQLAELMGCSRIKINRVERALTDLTMPEADLLAQVLHLPVAYFFGEAELQA